MLLKFCKELNKTKKGLQRVLVTKKVTFHLFIVHSMVMKVWQGFFDRLSILIIRTLLKVQIFESSINFPCKVFSVFLKVFQSKKIFLLMFFLGNLFATVVSSFMVLAVFAYFLLEKDIYYFLTLLCYCVSRPTFIPMCKSILFFYFQTGTLLSSLISHKQSLIKIFGKTLGCRRSTLVLKKNFFDKYSIHRQKRVFYFNFPHNFWMITIKFQEFFIPPENYKTSHAS